MAVQVRPAAAFAPAETEYPYFVMPLHTFMKLDGLLPDHQVCDISETPAWALTLVDNVALPSPSSLLQAVCWLLFELL